jgi:hypothetical protein
MERWIGRMTLSVLFHEHKTLRYVRDYVNDTNHPDEVKRHEE